MQMINKDNIFGDKHVCDQCIQAYPKCLTNQDCVGFLFNTEFDDDETALQHEVSASPNSNLMLQKIPSIAR